MKIVICDDSPEDLETIRGLLTRYGEVHENIKIEAAYYIDSVELYHKIQENMQCDIYILDMIMSQKTGIDIGSLIRSTDKNSVIIYITSSDDFALDAYEVHAVRYLLKPVQETVFIEALDYAVSSISKSSSDSNSGDDKVTVYPVKTKDGLVVVPYSKIEYIENYSRMLNVCLTDKKSIKSIFIRRSFDEEVRQMIESQSFLQVHKSFLVNMHYVDKLAQGSIIMESGANIPVSKARAADVKKEYLKFISKHYK